MFRGPFNRLPFNRPSEERKLVIEAVPFKATAGIFENVNIETITPPSLEAQAGVKEGTIIGGPIISAGSLEANATLGAGDIVTKHIHWYIQPPPLKAYATHTGAYGGPGGPEVPGGPLPPDAPEVIVKPDPFDPPYDLGPGSWEWPRPSRDNQHTGRTKGKTFFNPKGIWYEMAYSWEHFTQTGDTLGINNNAGPVMDEERTLFVFFENSYIPNNVLSLLAVRRDGTVKFRKNLSRSDLGINYDPYLWCESAIYHDGHLYLCMTPTVGSTNYLLVIKVSTVTGNLVWSSQFVVSDSGYCMLPVIHNDTLIIPGRELIAMYLTGGIKWRRNAGPHANDSYSDHGVSIGPITGRIYITTWGQNHLTWFNPSNPAIPRYKCALHCIDFDTGALIWERPAEPVQYQSGQGTYWDAPRWCVRSAPTITSKELILVSDERGIVPAAINRDGQVVWATNLKEASGTFNRTLSNGTLSHDETVFNIVGWFNTYHSLDVRTGAVINSILYQGNCEIHPFIDGDNYTYFIAVNWEETPNGSRYLSRVYKVNKVGEISKIFVFGNPLDPDNVLKPIPEGHPRWHDMQNNAWLSNIFLDYSGRMYLADSLWGGVMALDFGIKPAPIRIRPLVSAHTNAMIQYAR